MAGHRGATIAGLTNRAKRARELAHRGLRMLEIAEDLENNIDRLAARAGYTIEDVYRRCGETHPNDDIHRPEAVARRGVSFRHGLPVAALIPC
jgi:hypothetical protein